MLAAFGVPASTDGELECGDQPRRPRSVAARSADSHTSGPSRRAACSRTRSASHPASRPDRCRWVDDSSVTTVGVENRSWDPVGCAPDVPPRAAPVGSVEVDRAVAGERRSSLTEARNDSSRSSVRRTFSTAASGPARSRHPSQPPGSEPVVAHPSPAEHDQAICIQAQCTTPCHALIARANDRTSSCRAARSPTAIRSHSACSEDYLTTTPRPFVFSMATALEQQVRAYRMVRRGRRAAQLVLAPIGTNPPAGRPVRPTRAVTISASEPGCAANPGPSAWRSAR